MARHENITRCGITVECRFWPIPLMTPAKMDQAQSRFWQRVWLTLNALHMNWLTRRTVLSTACDCCTPADYNWPPRRSPMDWFFQILVRLRVPRPIYYWLLDRLTDNNGWRPLGMRDGA